MAQEYKAILDGIGSLQKELRGYRGEHSASSRKLSELGRDVKELTGKVTRIEGVKDDVKRVEGSLNDKLGELKKEYFPLVVERAIVKGIKRHEKDCRRFVVHKDGTAAETSLSLGERIPIPEWVVWTAVFVAVVLGVFAYMIFKLNIFG